MSSSNTINLANPHLSELKVDHLYHIGFNSAQPLEELFGDVQVVILGGANARMHDIARIIGSRLKNAPISTEDVKPIGETSRFHLFKVGPVMTASHQMGQPSFSILLHEITKLLSFAKAKNVVYIRLGTCGGIRVDPGTVVFTDRSYDGALNNYHTLINCGKTIHRESRFSEELNKELVECAEQINIPNTIGNTMCADDFYEGQSRLDGAICEISQQDKMDYLVQLNEKNIINIEMESLVFGAFTKYLNIKATTMCVTLIRRLDGDQVADGAHEFVQRPIDVLLQYLKKRDIVE